MSIINKCLTGKSSGVDRHNNLAKRADSMIHHIKDEEVLGKLKFVKKDNLLGNQDLSFKCTYTRKGSWQRLHEQRCLRKDPNQAVELVMSVNLEEHEKREKERQTKARHATIVLDKEVDQEVNEGFKEQMKLKLKVVQQLTPDAQLLLDLKKGSRADEVVDGVGTELRQLETSVRSCVSCAEPSTVTVNRDYAKVEHHRNFTNFLINLDFATLNKKPE
ncbi:hypothetical protein Tco_0190959 [Tanacetum coccineum]